MWGGLWCSRWRRRLDGIYLRSCTITVVTCISPSSRQACRALPILSTATSSSSPQTLQSPSQRPSTIISIPPQHCTPQNPSTSSSVSPCATPPLLQSAVYLLPCKQSLSPQTWRPGNCMSGGSLERENGMTLGNVSWKLRRNKTWPRNRQATPSLSLCG